MPRAVYYDEIAKLGAAGKLQGKNVAVFGLGDQEGYEANFADGTGELHDVFQSHGCNMFGCARERNISLEARAHAHMK